MSLSSSPSPSIAAASNSLQSSFVDCLHRHISIQPSRLICLRHDRPTRVVVSAANDIPRVVSPSRLMVPPSPDACRGFRWMPWAASDRRWRRFEEGTRPRVAEDIRWAGSGIVQVMDLGREEEDDSQPLDEDLMVKKM